MQRYDPDPAAKAAAASVLASKLGADSGLKVYLGDEPKINVATGKSNDVEVLQSSGLRNRKQLHTRSSSAGSNPLHHSDEETSRSVVSQHPQTSEHNNLVVNHHNPQGSTMNDGGWIARIAALLVGEDPTQSYALICGNCHMHNGKLTLFTTVTCIPLDQFLFLILRCGRLEIINCLLLFLAGLARKEDYVFITYYCPHCSALNRPKESEEHVSSSITTSPQTSSLTKESNINPSIPLGDSIHQSNCPLKEGLEVEEVEKLG